uniref:NAC domain-containing protein n=1 Tax=Heterorhabditis bacteriophora TaxID=37862 RepID=A0A1I7WJW5_HETBA
MLRTDRLSTTNFRNSKIERTSQQTENNTRLCEAKVLYQSDETTSDGVGWRVVEFHHFILLDHRKHEMTETRILQRDQQTSLVGGDHETPDNDYNSTRMATHQMKTYYLGLRIVKSEDEPNDAHSCLSF